MGPNLERLQKILFTLLIDYSEEEIEEELSKIPDKFKKVTRKHYETRPDDSKIFVRLKGEGNSSRMDKCKKGKGFEERNRRPVPGFTNSPNKTTGTFTF